MPRYGCVNVHASLLPRYRGAAPIQWAVIDGEAVSGVTTMLMDEGLDTGDMLEKAEIPLDKEETGGSLFEKLSILGGELILSTLEKLQNGTAVRTPQGEPDTPYAKMLKKSMGQIDWSMEGQPSGGDGKGSSFHQGAPVGGEKADGYSRFLKRLPGGGRYGSGSIRREEICIC